jgi:hypothetical protein
MKYIISFLLIMLMGFQMAFAQKGEILELEQVAIDQKSPLLSTESIEVELLHRDVVKSSYNNFLQIHFSSYNLDKAYLKIFAPDNPDAYQILDKKSIDEYSGYSSVFSTSVLIIEVYSTNPTKDVFYQVDKIISRKGATKIKTICGVDNRVLSTDVRVARMFAGGGCTAWLMSNGSLLTAGHCVSDNWGVLNLGTNVIVEFNVPVSTPGGVTVPSAPQDQYVIDVASVEFELTGADGTTSCKAGQDWAIFEVFDNATTGLQPVMAQGDFFRPTTLTPSSTSNIRITGHGNDSNGPNQNWRAQQTSSDNYDSRVNNGANGIYYRYETDTEGANSGSPVIKAANTDFTYGIHTCGGCGATSGTNLGTSFQYDPLEIEMNDFISTTSIHVDKISDTNSETGSIFRPFDTVQEAENAADIAGPGSNRIILVKGTYNEVNNILLDKAMFLTAPVGNVLIE